ncbi:MAG: secretin and TonB N-terminal domain-containing protein [Candidatus Omnitrophica bacterium]|nr:secretin and TonB N-terminal domain-containing protein [Candidatus Omnitrophota bacterium]
MRKVKIGRRLLGTLLLAAVLIGGELWAGEKSPDELFQQARNLYTRRQYQEAITAFETLQQVAPEYRRREVEVYLRSAKQRLVPRKPGATYGLKEEKVPLVEVKREGEFEVLAREAERVLLDTSSYLDNLKRQKIVSEFRLVDAYSNLKLAREAYENKRYTEAVRLANKARFIGELLVEGAQKEQQPLLGEIGSIPVTLNLTDADLEQTLKLIYELTGANIILSRGVSGRVTLNVKGLPLQQVLNLICEANGLRYVEEDKVIKVMTVVEYQQRPDVQRVMNRRVFSVLYGDGQAIAKALKETFKLESIVFEPRTNSIVVDVANPAQAQQLADVISSLDTPISQVLLEAKIISISGSEDDMFGIDWLISSRLITSLGTPTTITGPRFGGDVTFTPGVTNTLPGGFSFGITNSEVNSLITALTTKGQVKLVQAPKIMCLNGTNAIISVTQNYPYIIPEYEEIYNDQGVRTGTRQTVNTYEEEVGTEFVVTPVILRNRNVFLNLQIYDSRLVEIKKLSAVAANLRYETEQPIISSRETSQNVTLFDGQTLVIGGMIQERKEFSQTAIPFVHKIPLLGYLFKKPKYTSTRDELLLFLTPRVVTTFEEAQAVSQPEVKKGEKEIDPGILKRF